VVLDNAPFHTAGALRECEEGWQEVGLSLYRLPAYCPHLNLIEGCGEGSRVSSCHAASTTRWAS
jgi:hypothetical protein